MRIFAIDPGTTESGVCHYDTATRIPSQPRQISNIDLMREIRDAVPGVGHDIIAIEMIGVASTVGSTTFETLVWIGRFLEASRVTTVRILRKTVVSHVCGVSRAGDTDVNRCLWDRYGGREVAKGNKKAPGPLFGFQKHTNQALALAIAVAETVNITTQPEPQFGVSTTVWVETK